MNKVLVDQGSSAKVIYPDLFKGLKLRSEDLTQYDSPLIGFDGKVDRKSTRLNSSHSSPSRMPSSA